MTDSHSTLAELLPEIFPIVSSHLPLYAHPSTLLSLALTDHRLKGIVIPRLLYQHLSLKGEKRTCQVLGMLKTHAEAISAQTVQQGGEIPLAHYVHRLCISTELSKEARASSADTISQLRALVDLGCLSNLVSLTIHLSDGWYMDEDYAPVLGFGRFSNSFWRSLKEKCPKLTEISLTGVTDMRADRWVEDSGLLEYQGLESFRLHYRRHHLGVEDGSPATPAVHRLFDNLTTFSPFLHTLALCLGNEEDIDATAENGLFIRRLPHLRVLTLQHFTVGRPEVAAEFWACHPTLERVELSQVAGRWFEGLTTGALPRLNILKAPFGDVRTLVPLLGDQLINLTVTSSINAQVPYLLRSVLPNGLASLRSLGIVQRASKHSQEVGLEGGRWREDEEGVVSEVSKRQAAKAFDTAYIMAIARGAPNLEELEFVGKYQPPLDQIASSLSTFTKLKRVYISGAGYWASEQFIQSETERSFLEVARDIARGCANLESITEVTRRSQNAHVTARIQRVGGPVALREEAGCGRVVGLGDSDYPSV
jgi:hypothetical protein